MGLDDVMTEIGIEMGEKRHIRIRTGEVVKCKTCGKDFYIPRSRVKKKNVGIYCSVECKNKGLRVISVCRTCGKEFWRKSRGKKPYCSKRCSGIGRRNGKTIKCEICGKLTYKSKIFIDNAKHHFCSLNCANKFQGRNKLRFKCKICGIEFMWSKSRIIDNNPKYCSIKCRDVDPDVREMLVEMNRKQQLHSGPNKLEILGQEILKGLDVEYEEQFLIGKKFTVDVYIPDSRLIIQWDGDYWHCHPKYTKPDERQLKRKLLDVSQNAYFRKCGYGVLRFWESDVKKRPGWVRKMILGAMKEQTLNEFV